MGEVKRIAELLRKTYCGEPWHGPSLKESLAGVTYEMAFAKPQVGAHTISVIINHVAFWMEVVCHRLDGKIVEPTPDEDWRAPAEMTKDAWDKTLMRLETAYESLVSRIQALTPVQLESPASGKNYDNYTMLHGVIDHNVYHSGQIALLRKNLMQRK
ncbi:MAG: DinB family protein [Bacteroidetes bacterium]|nr:DinB family protein [Bacteroidota bacterium]